MKNRMLEGFVKEVLAVQIDEATERQKAELEVEEYLKHLNQVNEMSKGLYESIRTLK
jgi:hypothetical protein